MLLPQPLGKDVITRFDFGPAEVAATVAAITNESHSSQGVGGFGGASDVAEVAIDELPESIRLAAPWLSAERWRLLELQWLHGVYEPMPLSTDALILTFEWASGRDWQTVASMAAECNMADGDLFRCLRRTLDVLEGLSQGLTLDGDFTVWRGCVAGAVLAVKRSPLVDNAALEDGRIELVLGR